MDDRAVKSIVILGGGTAGWMSACYLGSYARKIGRDLKVTIIEAPDIPTVGVGEGTWPTIRGTLKYMGLSEREFLLGAHASFKQGSRFVGWVDGSPNDYYHHPLTLPRPGDMRALLAAWQRAGGSFGEMLNAQSRVVEQGIAPRRPDMPDYETVLGYSYHLDAGKFAALLKMHAVERLGVRHISDRMVAIRNDDAGNIAALETTSHGEIEGDLFIDCTGHASLLVGKHFGVDWIDCSRQLLNDRALASQVPTLPDSPIASVTVSTAQSAGWIWDIALPSRRGIGYVHSSQFCDEAEAEATLRDYIDKNVPGADAKNQAIRLLKFPTGYRAEFWHKNAFAIGLSAGFIEPLEASSIVSIEKSLEVLVANFPVQTGSMKIMADRVNDFLGYAWGRIVDFIKLHYILTQRTEPYWQAQRDPSQISPRLAELLEVWRDQPPSMWDLNRNSEVFNFDSYQFVYYGMRGPLPADLPVPDNADQLLAEVRDNAARIAAQLPTNRAYFDALHAAAALSSSPTRQAVG
jgi:tryptophan halogenase